MNDILMSPIRLNELESLVLNQVRKALAEIGAAHPSKPADELPIGIEEACRVTGYAKPTIYSKFNRREIPGYRRAQRLYFYKSELLEWIRSGKRSTLDEIKADALNSLAR